jgi:DNA-directed RNA polymerase beta subunit
MTIEAPLHCRVLFRKMTKETSSYVRRQFEQGNDINWRDAVKGNTITQGLRYSLATGNWGLQGDLAIKPGVAQVRLPCLHVCGGNGTRYLPSLTHAIDQ